LCLCSFTHILRAKKDLIQDLVKGKYEKFSKKEKKKETEGGNDLEIKDKAAEEEESGGYDYLLSMKLWSLTKERVESLKVLY
jgi:DNA topoisomerase-2